ncbi:helix-turn-helix domain-containing protein [Sandaracinus amylolyticus]|uniref:helix-turn-helix domain-containing protein n=1 Tax=Sandaracinus amylolyticus TaxID=927083 RepID=UPI001F4410DF|nr:XRE family transcriptional regulator [Sandaracinus amylolyticus]UJR82828.1 Hypothetical protein I5071_48930 [Sandaracinus amylolyticus]
MQEPTSVRAHLGAALRRAREAKGLTVSELARRSGIAKATLSELEAGRANPTLETLWALAVPLEVSLGELVDPPAPSMTVVRATEGTKVRGVAVVGRLIDAFESGGMRCEMFEAEVLQKRQESPAHARGVVEHLVCTSGRLRVGPVDAPVDLGPGDYVRMSPTWPHVYQGLRRGTRMVLLMQFPSR